MKSQIKRFSKSTLSVILAFCMLISCLTVGMIATDAAYDDNEKVGAVDNSEAVGATGSFTNGSTLYFDISSETGWSGSATIGAIFYYANNNNLCYNTDSAYGYNSKGNLSSYTSTNSLGNNIYSVTVPAGGLSHVVFVRLDSGNTTTVWNYTNKMAASDRSSDSQNEVVLGGWDNNSSWSTYTPPTPKTVYFKKGSLSWSNVYVAFFNANAWEDNGVTTNKSSKVDYHQMTLVSGTTDIYEYTTTSDFSYLVFIKDNQDGYGNLWQTEAAYASGYTAAAPLYTPQTADNKSVNSTTYYDTNDNASFDLNGTWSQYPPSSCTLSLDKTTKQTINIGETFDLTVSSTNCTGSASNLSITSSNSSYVSATLKSSGTNSRTYTIKALQPTSSDVTLTAACSADSDENNPTLAVAVTTPTLTVTYDPASVYVGSNATGEPTVTANNVHSGTTISGKSFSSSGSAGTINASTGVVTSSASTTGSVTVTATATVTYNGISCSATGTATVTVKDRETVYLLGLTNEYTWNKTDSGDKANKMSYNSTTGLYEITMNLYSINSTTYTGNNGFQIDVDNSRFSKTYTLTTNATSTTLAAANNNNLAITTKDTDTNTAPYKFTYSTDTKNLTVYYPGIVTFNANGHGTAPAKKVVAYNETTTAPTAPTEAGYTFGGWYKEAACTNAWDFSTDTVTEDTVLYAKWTQDSYAITYPTETNFSISNKSHASSAHYGDTVSFTVTPSSGYRITGVTYTPTGGSAQNCTAGSNNTYSFTMPAANVTISVSTVQTYTVTLTAGEGFDSRQYKLGSSGTYQSYTSGTELTVDAGTDVYFKVTYDTGYEYSANSGLTVVTANTEFKTAAVSANVTATLTAEKIPYALTGSVSPAHGTVTFYSDSACTTQITTGTATYQQTVYAKYTPADGYVLKNFTYSGTGITNTSTSGNVFTFKMGYAAATITANVMLQYSVNYYVDMHDNSMSGKTVEVAIVTDGGGNTVAKDSNGNDCKATLTRQGNSTLYMASINTPVTQTSGSYNGIYVRITYTGKTPVKIFVSGTRVATLASTHEMWLEAENETPTQLTVNYSTRSATTVADGYRRIYLAKPYGWQTSESAWENIGIYHWGDYTDIGWDSGIKMNYLGYSGTGADGYHYYYADIPKTIDGNKVSNLIFQGWGSNQSAGSYSKAQTGNIEDIPDSANFFILSKDGNAFVGTKSDEDAIIPNYTRYVSSVAMNKNESTEVNITPTYTGGLVTYTPKVVGTQGESNYINHGDYVTVDSHGIIHPVKSTIGLPDDCAEIIVKVYSTIGRTIYEGSGTDAGDCLTYTVRVNIHDPSQFNGFEIMSLESKTYEVKIPNLDSNGEPVDTGGTLPGYFDMSNVVMTVEGIHGVTSSTSSAIITQTSTASVDGVGTVCTAFTVQYAKANSLFENYGNISIIGKVTTKSIRRNGGDRYGHDHWTEDGTTKTYTTSRVIDNGIETATTEGIPFDNTKTTYSDIFAAYQYVDVTFTFTYYEYKPEVDEDGMINYPYDSTWAGTETLDDNTFNKKVFTVTELGDGTVKGSWAANASAEADTPCVTLDISAVSSSGGNWCAWTWGESDGRWITGNRNGNIITFADNDVDNNIIFVRMNAGDAMNWNNAQNKTADLSSRSHNLKTVTVSNFEIRNLVKSDIIDKTSESIVPAKLTLLVNGAAQAMGVMPESNYYNYKIDADTIPLDEISKVEDENQVENPYAVNVTVNMSHSVKQYKVYVNGDQIKDSNNNPLTYTYQQYAEPSVQNPADWYAVDSLSTTNTTNAPLLATGVNSYRFRVKGSANSTNTYLRTAASTNPHGDDFLRSEVDFSHYEVTHQGSNADTMKEYLLQNFYIADFFSPAEVLDSNSYSGKGKFGPAYKVETVTESTSTSSGNITVYFTDSLDWNDIHIYYWGENINNVNWPGSVMTQYGTDGAGKKIYSAEIPGTAEGVIFTGNNNQTVDITNNIANGSHWKSKNETVQNGIPYDDAQFVGGGVVYYSMNGATENNQGTPFANAVSSGYVNGDSSSADYGKINANAIKEMLKSNIEAQYAKDNIAGAVGENEAMKIAYGTEIAATKNKEGGFNTGIIYRYLPLNQYKRDGNGTLLAPDQDGNYAYDVNKNTFRYSNSLQSYQYVYASGNENKATNQGKNMRLYSYYVYSYVAYNQETNVPETRYEIVISDNYSDASTYWEGNPNPDPSN